MTTPAGASLAHLLGRLAVVEDWVGAAVARQRAADPDPDDHFRGLYLTDDHVDQLLSSPPSPFRAAPTAETLRSQVEQTADEAEVSGADLRLRRLDRSFALQPLDVDLLLVALAPDLDPRMERLYGYLNDDVTRRRASTGLALELCGVPLTAVADRVRLGRGSPLLEGRLLTVEDEDRPFLTRSLRVPDRVTAHLLGSDEPDPDVAPLLVSAPLLCEQDASALARAIKGSARLTYVRERPGSSGRALAVAALAEAGLVPVTLDLTQFDAGDDATNLAGVAGREARLRGGGLVAGPVEALAERGPQAVRAFAEQRCAVVLVGRAGWDQAWSRTVPLLVDATAPSPMERAAMWRASLNGDASGPLDVASLSGCFRLDEEQVARAATSARLQATLTGSALGPSHFRAGARAQNATGLERLARRIEPQVGWADLILPPGPSAQLQELAGRARHRDLVLDQWGMRPGGGRGRGITALFAGDSGTGKTMSAEVIAGELGLDLYAVNLATVVDKYIGETEKNLERIFTEADGVNAVLLFDEAEALFGKRSDVRDAHDRYANIEVAYLLQRMETFNGLAVLATNLRANLDEAFARRLDAVIDFPMPEVEYRRQLWDRCLAAAPRGDDLDLDFCARAFELSGGNIRSITVSAAYLAADAGRAVGMADLIRATQREYRKLGRLCVEAEFGPYLGTVGGTDVVRP